eukprot:jgi/Galph1/4124/GphlegSOOS_G2767.1
METEQADDFEQLQLEISNLDLKENYNDTWNEGHSFPIINKENARAAEAITPSRTKRLIIKSLILENFKSYAGTVEVGPFHKRFTAVVGPNGSGKSNVIDAMLFVFGKRAKQMRLNRVSDLIYSAGEFQKQPNQTSVTFEVTRVAFMNNTSKYFLNREPTPYAEIRELLLSKGIDLENNRFLILQGEVEQIALMKPKANNPHEEGLLEYLEDIIGSNKYIEPIENALDEMERLNEERTLKLNRAKVVEKELKSLESSLEEAKAYIRRETEILQQKGLKCHAMIRNSQFSKQKAIEKLKYLEEKLETLKQSNIDIKNRMNELESSYRDRCSEYEKNVEDLNALKDEYGKYEQEDVKCREELKHLLKTQKQISSRIQAEQKNIDAQQNSQHKRELRIQELDSLIESLRARLSEEEQDLESVYSSMNHSTGSVYQEIQQQESELHQKSNEVQSLESDLKDIEEEISHLESSLEEPRQELNEAKKRISEIDSEINKLIGLNQANSYDFTLHSLEKIREEKQQLQTEEKSIEQKISKIRAKLESTKLETLNKQNKNQTMQSIQEAIKSGRLTGVLGRLVDLGTVDDEFDLAAGASIGTSADHLVVETANEAEKCVEFLKSNSLGRATFIILDKLEYLKEKMRSSEIPKGSRRLIDLIKPKTNIARLAFYFVIRDTLVASSFDEATRLAYQPTRRNRVVTIAGQLIEPSGTISGGGNTRVSFKHSQTLEQVDTNQIDHLENTICTLTLELENIKAKVRTLIERESLTLQEAEELTKEKDKNGVATKSLNEQKKNLIDRVESLKKIVNDEKSSELVKRRNSLLSKKQAIEDSYKKTSNEITVIEETLKRLNDQMNEIGGSPLAEAKRKVSSREEELHSSLQERAYLQFEIETSKKSVENSEKLLEKLENELSNIRPQIQSRTDQLSTLESEAMKVLENFKQLEVKHERQEEELKNLKEEYEAYKTRTSSARREESRIESQLEDIKKSIQDAESKLQYWKKQELGLLSAVEEHIGVLEGAKMLQEDSADLLSKPESFFIDIDSFELSNDWEKRIDGRIQELQEEMKKMSPDMTSISNYQSKENDYNKQVAELDAITKDRDAFRKQYDQLRRTRLELFMRGFSSISKKLKELYQMITLGGDAELELVDALDPFSEGVILSVRPPKKSWKNVTNLSGGEKTLSSLALVFSLHHFRPAALYFMDEIDAALDFRNVSIIANYVKERATDAQFIIVSLRNNMFELADRLVGIYKPKSETKSVTMNPRLFSLLQAH